MYIYQKFIRGHGLSIFMKYNGSSPYIDILIKSLEKLSSIDDMKEYCSINHWRRFNEVFTPFMKSIKNEDTIETIIEALFYENSPFMMFITWYYTWKRNCLGEQFNKMLSINKTAAYMVINSYEFNSRSKIIWDIDWRILYKSLYETLDKCCSKCYTILRTCRIDINSNPQFLFIINK